MKIKNYYIFLILFFFSIAISGSTKEKILDSLKNIKIPSLNKISINKRDLKFFGVGILSPIVLLLLIVPFVAKMPWYPPHKGAQLTPWSYYYYEAEKISTEGKYNLYEFAAKSTDSDDNNFIGKTKLFSNQDFVKTGSICAIVGMCGVGDIPNLMFPAVHSQLFPTDHFYVVGFEDFEKNRLLARSLGQDSEIIPCIHALNYLVTKYNYEKIILVGESAGGAAAINIIPILQNEQHPIWNEISLKKSIARDKILEKLQNGGIWLRAPLLSVSNTAKHGSNRIFAPVMKYIFAPILTQLRYNPFKKEPIDTVLDWKKNSNIPVLFTPADNDEILGPANQEFFTRLQNQNGKEHSFIRIYNEGTHIQSFKDEEYPKKVHNFLTTGKID